MKKRFDFLERLIKAECAGEPVYYVANPGNWGDAFIRHGTLKFFKERNIKVQEITNLNDVATLAEGGTLLYGGGGGWCKLWNHSQKYINQWQQKFKIIVLPSTYQFNYSIPNVIFFRRDNGRSREHMPDAHFCHDMAFYIQDDFFTGQQGGCGYFFRTDAESSRRIAIPPNNLDLSTQGKHLNDVAPFFVEVDKYSVIHTDRLHVGIAACLLKKELHLYLGSYFKSRAVYNASMKKYFDNVHFVESLKKQALP
jgi:exopolysaccharide biosynthesis predicted pyruvyltransferase EpsI